MEEEHEPQPEFRRWTLPPEVLAARAEAERTSERVAAVAQPRIEAYRATLTMALDDLARPHQRVIDVTDLDLEGETLSLAVWEVSTRSLGLGRALVALLQAGFGPETVATRRAMHEANQLLHVLQGSEDDQWRRRYFAEDHVKPWELREAEEAIQAEFEAANPGADPVAARMVELTREIYGRLSQGGHNRRPSIRESISVGLRTAATGPHPDPFSRASYVADAGRAIEETIIPVGGALTRFYGPTLWTDDLAVTRRTLAAIWDDQPLDEECLRRDAGL